MTPRGTALAAAAALAIGIIGTMGWTAGTAWAGEPDAARQAEILDFVHNTCVTCHGPGLTGEVGPPLTPAALKDKDSAMLAATILNGIISKDEAAWLVGRLKAGLD